MMMRKFNLSKTWQFILILFSLLQGGPGQAGMPGPPGPQGAAVCDQSVQWEEISLGIVQSCQ